MKAYCLIRSQPWYRREAFECGLRAAGHQVLARVPREFDRDSLVVMWNRYAEHHELATRVERAGGTVMVAENGYLGAGGTAPKFDVWGGVERGHYYALAIGGHNGSGAWFTPPDDSDAFKSRWRALGVELRPLREAGSHILICPSRNFGRPDMTMPGQWVTRTIEALRKVTKRPIRVREHPGNQPPARSLAEDLVGAWGCWVWASSAGVHALVAGIPVVQGAPHWICQRGAVGELATLERLDRDESAREVWRRLRKHALRRMAWAQWTVDEIASGEPFTRLLGAASDAGHVLPAARQA